MTEIQKIRNGAQKQVVMPTHKDVLDAKVKGFSLLKYSAYCTNVRKIPAPVKSEIVCNSNIPIIQQSITDIAEEIEDYQLIVDYQIPDGMTFNEEEMEILEKAQRVHGVKHLTLIEPSPKQDLDTFKSRLSATMKRNPSKEIVPLFEPTSVSLSAKMTVIAEFGITKCAIRFRSPAKNKSLIEEAIANLHALEIESFVFGVPRKSRRSNGALVAMPLYFGADNVSHQIAWSGGPSTPTFLDSDWALNRYDDASSGNTAYDNVSRKDFLKVVNKADISSFLKIDLLNEANYLLLTGKFITKESFERFFEVSVPKRR